MAKRKAKGSKGGRRKPTSKRQRIKGYTRKDGTRVKGYLRKRKSAPPSRAPERELPPGPPAYYVDESDFLPDDWEEFYDLDGLDEDADDSYGESTTE